MGEKMFLWKETCRRVLFFSSVSFYLVAVVFHQLEDKSSVHERQQVIEEEGQANVDFLCLLYLLKQNQINKTVSCTEWILSSI